MKNKNNIKLLRNLYMKKYVYDEETDSGNVKSLF